METEGRAVCSHLEDAAEINGMWIKTEWRQMKTGGTPLDFWWRVPEKWDLTFCGMFCESDLRDMGCRLQRIPDCAAKPVCIFYGGCCGYGAAPMWYPTPCSRDAVHPNSLQQQCYPEYIWEMQRYAGKHCVSSLIVRTANKLNSWINCLLQIDQNTWGFSHVLASHQGEMCALGCSFQTVTWSNPSH